MKIKNYLTILLLTIFAVSLQMQAQTVSDFEGYELEANSFLNDSGPTGGFASGNVFLSNAYFPGNYAYWSGWAISNTTDTLTEGFINESSAIAGGGADETATFALAFGSAVVNLTGNASGRVVDGMYVTNNAYAYWSMKNGDSFAKRFGGETGDDPDFFLLTIHKYLEGNLSSDSVNFYLADYRFEDNSEDYIVDEWTWLDLTSLGNADSLQFSFSSSDVGEFGMNTPAYVCVDQIQTSDAFLGVEEIKALEANVYPNPTTDFVLLDWENNATDLMLLNLNGQIVFTQSIEQGKNQIDLQTLPKGTYFLTIREENTVYQQRIVKN